MINFHLQISQLEHNAGWSIEEGMRDFKWKSKGKVSGKGNWKIRRDFCHQSQIYIFRTLNFSKLVKIFFCSYGQKAPGSLEGRQIHVPQFLFLTPTRIIGTVFLLISLGILTHNMTKLAKTDIVFICLIIIKSLWGMLLNDLGGILN